MTEEFPEVMRKIARPATAMKAYQGDTSDEEYGTMSVIVIARTQTEARATAANTLNCDPLDVEISRTPQFDSYARFGFVPAEVLIDAGWWQTCAFCGDRVDLETAPDYVAGNREVFCSQAHYMALIKKAMRQLTDKDRHFEMVYERFPGVKVLKYLPLADRTVFQLGVPDYPEAIRDHPEPMRNTASAVISWTVQGDLVEGDVFSTTEFFRWAKFTEEQDDHHAE
jgi:hypothetical protein